MLKSLLRSRTLLLLLFGVFTFVPLGAFIMGARGGAIENRALAERPPISVGALFDTEQTAAFDDYLVDTLPFREKMVNAEARFDLMLGDSPTGRVVVGRDGWLFLDQSIEQRCLGVSDINRFASTVGRADRVVEAAGRHLIVVVAPDKASIYPEQLSDKAPCVISNAQALDRVLSPNHVMGWSQLVDASPKMKTYFRMDTHWTPTGARILAELIVNIAADGAWTHPGRVELGATAFQSPGDLNRMLGLVGSEEYETFSETKPDDNSGCSEEVAPPDGDLLCPSTYMAHDSFGNALAPFLRPYFSTFETAKTSSLLGPLASDTLASSDVVIWESVQRFAFDRVVRKDLAAELVVALRNELALEPVAVSWDGPNASIPIDQGQHERYVLVSLADGIDTAEFAVNGQQRTINAEEPVRGFYIDGPMASLELLSGDVDVQIVRIPVQD